VWEEECQPGRLWLKAPSEDDVQKTAWIVYLCGRQKLLAAPMTSGYCVVVNDAAYSFADRQLDAMTGLDVDWAEEGAERPNSVSYKNAREVLYAAYFVSMPIEYTTASASSGIVVCFKRGDVYADIECFNSGEIWAIVSSRNGNPQTWQVELGRASVEAALREINSLVGASA
jgi:hypothetical protein